MAILTFQNKDTEYIFLKKKIKGIDTNIQQSARIRLIAIHKATTIHDLENPPGNKLEKLKGDLKDWYSIRVNRQWRIIFKWERGNAYEVLLSKHYE